jgi:nitrogen fixation protein NifZ
MRLTQDQHPGEDGHLLRPDPLRKGSQGEGATAAPLPPSPVVSPTTFHPPPKTSMKLGDPNSTVPRPMTWTKKCVSRKVIRNDGTYPGEDTGKRLVEKGESATSSALAPTCNAYIYSVHFLETNFVVGCLSKELELPKKTITSRSFPRKTGKSIINCPICLEPNRPQPLSLTDGHSHSPFPLPSPSPAGSR